MNKLLASLYWSMHLNRVESLRFRLCILAKKPYLGGYMQASQVMPPRISYMEMTVKEMLQLSPFLRILEIGSWCGASAILFAKITRGKGEITCIDPWENEEIHHLFIHNVKCSGMDKVIRRAIKSNSDDAFKLLKDEMFDMVYIDGDHNYHQVKRDLQHYSQLVNYGGLICGDDLEFQIPEVDLEFTRLHQNEEMVTDVQGRAYHPGVALALKEFFETEVSNFSGFWAMRRTSQGWTGIEL